MILFLSKLVPTFLYPLGLAIVFTVLALAFGRFHRSSRVALILALVLLWLPSMPVTANLLALNWEAAYPPVAPANLPQADAIVLLGGLLDQPLPPRLEPDLNQAADRLFEAARLFRAGKAPRVVVSAGNLPWNTIVSPEATWIEPMLGELGVPTDAITLESRSRNTRENAVFTASILHDKGWRTVLLVTSAAHMRRAMAAFRQASIEATAASADVRGSYPVYNSLLDFLPNADALSETSGVIKEMIGLVYYRLRGWA